MAKEQIKKAECIEGDHFINAERILSCAVCGAHICRRHTRWHGIAGTHDFIEETNVEIHRRSLEGERVWNRQSQKWVAA